MGTFPGAPVHSLGTALAVEVQSIQVGIMANIVPPGTFTMHSAVKRGLVIVTVLGGKLQTTMITERISSSSCTKRKRNKKKQKMQPELAYVSERTVNLRRGIRGRLQEKFQIRKFVFL